MRTWSTIKEALGLAVRSKSLWLFGFFAGAASSSGGGGGAAPAPSDGLPGSPAPEVVLPIVLLLAAVLIGAFLMRLLSEGALIEGVRRSLRGEALTVGAGFREGWAHVGTVLLIKLAYLAASAGSLVLLALPAVIAARVIDSSTAAVMLAVPAVVVAVPLLVTLYLWQAFALRIAVLENRRAGDAIAKARLFLHGRLRHGLKLMVATLLGSVLVVLAGVVLLVPVGLLIAAASELLGPLALVPGLAIAVPAAAVIVAILGTYQSSVWTIGYLNQADA